MTEIWTDSFPGKIPKQNYSAQIINGEEMGLVIQLYGQDYDAVIDFGIIAGLQIFDEGTLLHCSNNDEVLKQNDFPSTIYLVENGAFGRYTADCMGLELYHDMKCRQYNIVTNNYLISVISQWEPDITVQLISSR